MQSSKKSISYHPEQSITEYRKKTSVFSLTFSTVAATAEHLDSLAAERFATT